MGRAVETTSSLANYLKEIWAFGRMTSTMVQRIAYKSVSDHEEGGLPRSPEPLQVLARLGASGAQPQHCEEEMQARVGQAHPQPDVLTVQLPMKSLKRRNGERVEEDVSHSIVAPFEMFSFLYTNYPENFARRFLGGAGARIEDASVLLRNFWAQVPETDGRKQRIAQEFVKRDDIADENEIWERAIPISIHGAP